MRSLHSLSVPICMWRKLLWPSHGLLGPGVRVVAIKYGLLEVWWPTKPGWLIGVWDCMAIALGGPTDWTSCTGRPPGATLLRNFDAYKRLLAGSSFFTLGLCWR